MPLCARNRSFVFASLGSALLLAGCQSATTLGDFSQAGVTQTIAPAVTFVLAAATHGARRPVLAESGAAPKTSQLGPAKYGLVVCEPVPTANAAALAAFGTGCGRWLHLMAAGQPALGATPLWNSLPRAEMEMRRRDLQLRLPQAVQLAHSVGVTHVAVGQIRGTSSHVTLTYRLWRIPQREALGGPISVSGTQAQVAAALPALARALDIRLGIQAPALPITAGMTPGEFAQVGSLPLSPTLTSAQQILLARIALHSPLAAMLLLSAGANADQKLFDGIAEDLLLRQPVNALVIAQLAEENPHALRLSATPATDAIQKFPDCFLLARANGLMQADWGTRAGERQAAEQCVRDAPQSATAWKEQAESWGEAAQDIRQSRTTDQISDQEWMALNHLYACEEAAARRAVILDPQYAAAWLELATAATFAGDNSEACNAIWQAIRKDPSDPGGYDWGLEMFQSKWLDDPAAEDKVARLAVAAPFPDPSDAINVVDELRQSGQEAAAEILTARAVALARARLAQSFPPADAHWQMALVLNDTSDPSVLAQALREYQAALVQTPNAPKLYDEYGQALEALGRFDEARTQYRTAASLDSFDALAASRQGLHGDG